MAAFGNAVSDFQIVAQSSVGYIVAVDMSASRVRAIMSVQGMTQALVFGTPVKAPVSLDILLGYLNSSGAPDIAFCDMSQTLHVFFKAATYPADQANRIGILFHRNVIPLAATSDGVDAPQEAHELVKAFTLRSLKQDKGELIEFDLNQAIVREKAKLGLT